MAPRWIGSRAASAFLLLLAIALVGGFFVLSLWPALERERRAENERSAMSAIHYLARLEASIRERDLDENGAQDFWTGDVAGMADLFSRIGPTSAVVSRLGFDVNSALLQDIALADPSRPAAKPYKGYWFAPMDLDADGKPLRINGRPHHPFAFGYCAYPFKIGVTGNNTFISNEGGTVFSSPAVWVPRARQWPTDLELRSRWSKPGG